MEQKDPARERVESAERARLAGSGAGLSAALEAEPRHDQSGLYERFRRISGLARSLKGRSKSDLGRPGRAYAPRPEPPRYDFAARGQRLRAERPGESTLAHGYLDALASARPSVVNDVVARGRSLIERLPNTPEGERLALRIKRQLAENADSNCALCTVGSLLLRTSGDVAQLLGRHPIEQGVLAFSEFAGLKPQRAGGGLEEQLVGIEKFFQAQVKRSDFDRIEKFGFHREPSFERALGAMREYAVGTQFAVYIRHEEAGQTGGHWIYAERRSYALRFLDFQTNRSRNELPLGAWDAIPRRPGVVGRHITAMGYYAFIARPERMEALGRAAETMVPTS